MERSLILRWFSVKEKLPADDDFVIVRCINEDEDCDFYFMAYYYLEHKKWFFFDGYEDMQVTHWARTPKIDFDIRYVLKDMNNG